MKQQASPVSLSSTMSSPGSSSAPLFDLSSTPVSDTGDIVAYYLQQLLTTPPSQQFPTPQSVIQQQQQFSGGLPPISLQLPPLVSASASMQGNSINSGGQFNLLSPKSVKHSPSNSNGSIDISISGHTSRSSSGYSASSGSGGSFYNQDASNSSNNNNTTTGSSIVSGTSTAVPSPDSRSSYDIFGDTSAAIAAAAQFPLYPDLNSSQNYFYPLATPTTPAFERSMSNFGLSNSNVNMNTPGVNSTHQRYASNASSVSGFPTGQIIGCGGVYGLGLTGGPVSLAPSLVTTPTANTFAQAASSSSSVSRHGSHHQYYQQQQSHHQQHQQQHHHHHHQQQRSSTPVNEPAPNTPFHSQTIPAIDVQGYFKRIIKYCKCDNEMLLAVVVYMKRICDAIRSEGNTFAVDQMSVHRLIITAFAVANKYFSDTFYQNARYAKVGGFDTLELNKLENAFLRMVNYYVGVNIEDLQRVGYELALFKLRSESMDAANSAAAAALNNAHQQQQQQRQQPTSVTSTPTHSTYGSRSTSGGGGGIANFLKVNTGSGSSSQFFPNTKINVQLPTPQEPSPSYFSGFQSSNKQSHQHSQSASSSNSTSQGGYLSHPQQLVNAASSVATAPLRYMSSFLSRRRARSDCNLSAQVQQQQQQQQQQQKPPATTATNNAHQQQQSQQSGGGPALNAPKMAAMNLASGQQQYQNSNMYGSGLSVNSSSSSGMPTIIAPDRKVSMVANTVLGCSGSTSGSVVSRSLTSSSIGGSGNARKHSHHPGYGHSHSMSTGSADHFISQQQQLQSQPQSQIHHPHSNPHHSLQQSQSHLQQQQQQLSKPVPAHVPRRADVGGYRNTGSPMNANVGLGIHSVASHRTSTNENLPHTPTSATGGGWFNSGNKQPQQPQQGHNQSADVFSPYRGDSNSGAFPPTSTARLII